MRNARLALAGASALMFLFACSDDGGLSARGDGSAAPTGGAMSGTGGAAPGAGGSSATATGGSVATGGIIATGGATGGSTGGATGSGGIGGSGGKAGGAGGSGAGGSGVGGSGVGGSGVGGSGVGGSGIDAGPPQDAGRDVICPPVCFLYCPYGNEVDSNGCMLCACKPAPADGGTIRDTGRDFICPPLCDLYCPYGNVMDNNGCELCKCKPAPGDAGTVKDTGPLICPPVCEIYCPNGNVLDDNGCPTCKCKPDPVDASVNCAAIAQRLLAEMQTGVGACTAVVRLDYTTLDILSYAFVCGKYSATDEASARRSATAAAVFPYTGGAGTGNLLSGPSPADQWVFYTPPGDFGGVAAVSDLTGLTTFAATIVWSGTGEILFPKSFSTADLGRGCEVPPPSSVRGINLASGEAQPRFDEAASIVRSTALPAAFTRWGGTFDAVVLLYPRTMGGFEASSAEYIVLLDGGWLE